MWKQKGEVEGEVIIGIIILALVITFWYVIVGIILTILALATIGFAISGMNWLYQNGWNKTFKSIIILIVGIPLCVAGVVFGVPVWKDYQYKRSFEGIIAEKEQNIQIMKQNLEKQLTNIAEVRNKYQSDISGFLGEIGEEKQKYSITSMAYATERVRYDVKLIQERDASLSKLNEIEKVTKNGYEEAVYMLRQLDGAKGMAKIMVDGSSLVNNAEVILQKYSSYTGTLAINPKELTFKSPEVIWQQYVKGRSLLEAILFRTLDKT